MIWSSISIRYAQKTISLPLMVPFEGMSLYSSSGFKTFKNSVFQNAIKPFQNKINDPKFKHIIAKYGNVFQVIHFIHWLKKLNFYLKPGYCSNKAVSISWVAIKGSPSTNKILLGIIVAC